MEKTVALICENEGTLDTIISVRGFDSEENFQEVLSAARADWNEGSDEFYAVLRKHASQAGYEILFQDYISFQI